MRERTLVVSVVGGLLGGLVGAAAMSAVHTWAQPGRSPPDPPPSPGARGRLHREGRRRAVANAPSTRRCPKSAKPIAGSIVHYAFGASMGLAQGAAAGLTSLAGLGGGLGFGAAVWLGAHV